MRILFISNLYPPPSIGGYEQICHDVAQRLKARGHDVRVLTSAFGVHDSHSPGNRTQQGVYRLLKLRTRPGTTAPEGKNRRRPQWLAANRLALEWHNSRVVRQVVSATDPDAIMVWNGGNMGRTFLSAAEQARPTATAYYLSDPWLAPVLAGQRAGSGVSPARRLYRLTLRAMGIPHSPVGTRHLVFCSRALQRQYERMGAEVSRAEVIYHGVASDLFFLRPQHIVTRSADEPFLLLYAGRIAPEKGVSTLVKALAALRALPGLQDQDARLALVGVFQSREYEAQLHTLIARLGLGSAVQFLPPVPRAEMPDLYARHDVLCFPSEWEEPFALTLLEAMAVGLPVVSTLCGGSAEVVRDGYNAVVFRAGHPRDLAERLAWVLTHPRQAAAIGRTASREVSQRYTLDCQTEAVEAYLHSMVA